MKGATIRKASVDDAAFIALLGRVTFTETFGHYFKRHGDLLAYYDRTFTVCKIRASLAKENNIFWIAFVDELPAGYAKLKKGSNSEFIPSQPCAQLQKIYVLKDFLSRKIGRDLTMQMIDEVRTSESRFIWLSVLQSNERAISFYKKFGFSKIGSHTFDIGQEHFKFLAMKKEL